MRTTCPSCGQECGVKIIDTGYGPTEAWGIVKNHEHIIPVSDCCEASLVDDVEFQRQIDEQDMLDSE